jgi:VWFA-related protein
LAGGGALRIAARFVFGGRIASGGRKMRTATTCMILGLLAVAGATVAVNGQQPVAQQPAPAPVRPAQVPTFRSTVMLVPLDVRVTDRDGNPITGLTQQDFTLIENGAKQEIRHFGVREVATERLEADPSMPLREGPVSLVPQTNRIFLIVLGRGRLLEPSGAVDALIDFVRGRLLPQDQVAVFAYNRATTFTRNHQSVVALLQRFKVSHEEVDLKVGQQMTTGLAGIYGSKSIPKDLQKTIDAMFEGSGLLASQRVAPADAAASRVEKDADRQIYAQIQKEIEVSKAAMSAAAGVTNLTTWSELDEIQTQMFSDLPLEDFISATAQTLQDLGNLYAAIAYLRNFEGEKHVVFFTERGLTMPRLEEDEVLASAANDARVAIDTVQTGGLLGQSGAQAPDGRFNETFAFRTLRVIAEMTGGVSSIAEDGAKAMARLDAVTRSGYLLGYYPSNAKWDGSYRKVEVKVNRPGATAYYRHGYYARPELGPFNRREFVTQDRIRAAASFRRTVEDIRVRVDASVGKAEDGAGTEVRISGTIDMAKLALRFVEGVHQGFVSIAVFCWDDKGEALANTLQNADIKLPDEVYKKLAGSGIPFKMRLLTSPAIRRVRVVVYDPKADLIGSVDKRM